MGPIRKDHIKQEVFDLYDDYAHSRIDRRQFLQKLSIYAVGGLTVTSLMSFIMPNYDSLVVDPRDPDLESEYIHYPSDKGGGKIRALLSKPAAATGKLGGIIVVHENRGLNPHIEDVARRAALEGYISLAPDALTPLGGYPGNDDEGRELHSQRDPQEMLEDFLAAYHYLKAHPDCNGKVGVVGFCFGGWISNMMAVRLPDLAAAVPYYGVQPKMEEVARIQAPLLIHYAENDARVNEGMDTYKKALMENGVEFSQYLYPDTNHGFHNNTTPRYDEAAAKLSWTRTMEFFGEKLK